MNSQLLCTFTNKNNLYDTMDNILETYDVLFNKVYVLENADLSSELLCTYNIDEDSEIVGNPPPKTILIHRKKHTNTLFTINAVNEIVKEHNNGVEDPNFDVPWENYQNCLLVTNNDGIKRIDTEIYEIVEFERPDFDKEI